MRSYLLTQFQRLGFKFFQTHGHTLHQTGIMRHLELALPHLYSFSLHPLNEEGGLPALTVRVSIEALPMARDSEFFLPTPLPYKLWGRELVGF